MALTIEALKANPILAACSDEQLAAIAEMSLRDEGVVIGQKTGEIYGGLDNDILTTSGMPKEGTEKTYIYARRVIAALKADADKLGEIRVKNESLKNEVDRLTKAVQEGGADAELKKQLAKTQADLTSVTKEYTDLKTAYDKEKADFADKMFGFQLDNEFAKATSGLKLKADLPAAVHDVLISQAVAKVKAMSPEFIEEQGEKVLAFHKDGAVYRNNANNLRPYTAAELLTAELKAMGVLDEGRTATGAGTGGGSNGGGNNGGGSITIAGARTREEARELITKELLSRGLVNGSDEFCAEMDKAWKENNISALPIQ